MTTSRPASDNDEGTLRECMRRLEAFAESPAAMVMGAFLGSNEEWPEGAELNDVFPAEDAGELRPLAGIRLWDVPRSRLIEEIVEFLCSSLAYGTQLSSARQNEARELAHDIVTLLGPEASWRVSHEQRQYNDSGGYSRMTSRITDDDDEYTFSAMLVGRGSRHVVVLIAFDDD
jgi:hypothetical protein